MKLEDLQRATTHIRHWENEWSDAVYVSAVDCPTKEDALSYYADLVGQEWESDYLDEVVVKIIPCCDHDVEDCDRSTSTECTKSVARKVWAFEP